ncbi:MAG TPA: MipA/OmpV family protein [Novosphingobium sp.]|nr:MipA/OmpV family protein [Novosphingobium sp.]
MTATLAPSTHAAARSGKLPAPLSPGRARRGRKGLLLVALTGVALGAALGAGPGMSARAWAGADAAGIAQPGGDDTLALASTTPIVTGDLTQPRHASQTADPATRNLAAVPQRGGLLFSAPFGGSDHTVFDGNFLVVAAGGGFTPQYDGAKKLSLTPGIGLIGRLGPFNFSSRGAGLAIDIIPDRASAGHQRKVTFALGPVIKYDANRSGKVDNPQVAALGRLRPWFEAGVTGAIAVHKLITPYDSLSFGSDIRWDITGRMKGQIISPSVSYFTPVGKGTVASVSAFGDIVDDTYARYNYTITPLQAAASGLPAYQAHGGLRSYGAQLIVAHDLNNNLKDGGFSVVAGLSYARLTGSAAATPITSLVGTANQWTFGAGIAYAF